MWINDKNGESKCFEFRQWASPLNSEVHWLVKKWLWTQNGQTWVNWYYHLWEFEELDADKWYF